MSVMKNMTEKFFQCFCITKSNQHFNISSENEELQRIFIIGQLEGKENFNLYFLGLTHWHRVILDYSATGNRAISVFFFNHFFLM